MSILKRAAEAIAQSNAAITESRGISSSKKEQLSSPELKSIQVDVSVIRQIMEERFKSIAESITPKVAGKGDKAEAEMEQKKNLSNTQKSLLSLQKSMSEFGTSLKGLGEKLTPKGTFGNILSKIAKGVLLVGMFKAFKYVAENWENIKKKWDEFRESKVFEYLSDAIGLIKDNFLLIGGVLVGATILGPIFSIIGTLATFASGIAAVAAAMAPILSFIAPLLIPITIISSIAYSLWEAFSDASDKFEETGSYIDASLSGISAFFGTIPDLLTDMLGWLAGAFGFEETEKVLKDFSWKDTFNEGFTGLKEWMDGLFTNPGAALEELTKSLFGGFADIGDYVWNKGVKPALEMVLGAFGFNMELPEANLGNIVRDNIRIVFNWLGDLFSGEKTLEALETLWTNVIGGFADIADWIGNGVINPLIEKVLGLFGVNIELGDWNLGKIARDAVDNIFGWIDTVFEDPTGYIKGLWNQFLGKSKDLGNWIYDNAIQPVVDWFTGTFAKIIDMLPSGEDIKQYLISTIEGMPGGKAALQLMGLIPTEQEIAMQQGMREFGDRVKTADLEELKRARLKADEMIMKEMINAQQTNYLGLGGDINADEQSRIDYYRLQAEKLDARIQELSGGISPMNSSRADDMNYLSKNQVSGSNSGMTIVKGGDTYNQGGSNSMTIGIPLQSVGIESAIANGGPYQ